MSPRFKPTPEGFWSRAILTNRLFNGSPCVEWQGPKDNKGYGRFGDLGLAHRWAFVWANGTDAIPAGTELDHLCRNRSCVAPGHLEAVTHKENVLRGASPSAICAAKTHCVNGHEFTNDNTLIRPDGSRKCRTCKRAADRRRSARFRGSSRRKGSLTMVDNNSTRDALRRMADEVQQTERESLVVAYSSVGSVYCTECIDNPDDPSYRAAPVLAGQLPIGRACDECGRVIATERTEPEPTQLRWGLNDVMWGDDDTTTVMLSGPNGEPYWLQLDAERAAVLRQDLAGPDTEADEQATTDADMVKAHELALQAADMVCGECLAPIVFVTGRSGAWWNHTAPAEDGHSIAPKPLLRARADEEQQAGEGR